MFEYGKEPLKMFYFNSIYVPSELNLIDRMKFEKNK